MPRLSPAPTRPVSPAALSNAANAAGFALAGFQDGEVADLTPHNERVGFRILAVLVPMVCAVGAIVFVALQV